MKILISELVLDLSSDDSRPSNAAASSKDAENEMENQEIKTQQIYDLQKEERCYSFVFVLLLLDKLPLYYNSFVQWEYGNKYSAPIW